MEETTLVTTPKTGAINFMDVAKGLAVSVITPVFTILISSLQAGALTFDWKVIGATALAAGLAYLSKNFFSPSQTIVKSEKA